MTDHGFDAEIVFIGSGFSLSQNIFRVKDVQTFILHRAHIKEIDGDDHIDVEVIFKTKTSFIPLHGIF